MLNALRHRNFRLFLTGQMISLVGTWMQNLATSWLVYRLTSSPLWLGISMFSSQIPTFVLGLFAGVVVDQVNRHKLLMWTQSLAAIQALVLATLYFSGKLMLAELIGLNLTLGVITAFDMPGRQSFYIQMIDDRKDLPNAIALNSSIMNGTRLIGPAIAGATIAAFGEGVCFLLNALSYIAVLIALALMKFEPYIASERKTSLLDNLKVGIRAAFKDDAIRPVLIVLAYLSLFGISFATLFPAIAAQIGNGPKTLGIVTVAGGLGSFAGALLLVYRKEVTSLGRDMGFAGLLFTIGLVFLSFASRASSLTLICICVFFATLGMMTLMASGNMVIQTLIDDDKRGRVMSFFTFSLLGIAPFGNLLIGAMAQRWGVASTLLIEGVISTSGAVLFFCNTSAIGMQLNQRLNAQSQKV